MDKLENAITLEQLRFRQAMPLDLKIKYSVRRIKEHVKRYGSAARVSFSGGKDSTVLLHLARTIYPDMVGLFSNTGLEFPEIVDFVKSLDNIQIVKPKKTFRQVVEQFGYPIISKVQSKYLYEVRTTKSQKLIDLRMGNLEGKSQKSTISQKWRYLIDAPFKISDKCCYHLKKSPMDFIKPLAPIIGTMASEGGARERAYLKNGCYNDRTATLTPISFWTEQDIWDYIHAFNIPYSSIYDMGYNRTGCIFCMYGVHLEKSPNRFQMLKRTHPKLWDYCINNLGLHLPLNWLGVDFETCPTDLTQTDFNF